MLEAIKINPISLKYASNDIQNKFIAARNVKECLPSLPLKTRKEKKKIKVFSRDNFVLP
jgi:hypothetical protein